jgi:hypothetical protein
MTKQADTAPERDRPVIEVTPAMIEAGVEALEENLQFQAAEVVVRSVFNAMEAVAMEASPAASAIID